MSLIKIKKAIQTISQIDKFTAAIGRISKARLSNILTVKYAIQDSISLLNHINIRLSYDYQNIFLFSDSGLCGNYNLYYQSCNITNTSWIIGERGKYINAVYIGQYKYISINQLYEKLISIQKQPKFYINTNVGVITYTLNDFLHSKTKSTDEYLIDLDFYVVEQIVLKYFIKYCLNLGQYHILNATIITTDNILKRTKDKINSLNIKKNNVRKEIITNEILDIVNSLDKEVL